MTVIVWDGTTLAADRLTVQGHTSRRATKIARSSNYIMGGSGEMATLLQMHQWVCEGRHLVRFPKDQMDPENFVDYLLVSREGVWRYENAPLAIKVEEPVYALGAGAQCAYGAMAMGGNAVDAVEIASRYNNMCGGGVDTLTLLDL